MTSCITKAYGGSRPGSFVRTGPLLDTSWAGHEPDAAAAAAGASRAAGGGGGERQFRLLSGKESLRWLSPKEVMRLHGYPAWFEFPDTVPEKDRFRMLGNGLNIRVVTDLCKLLLRH
jgi:site-specific DNA-cytosine methylase